VYAQEGTGTLSITTTYPNRVVEIDETININLDIEVVGPAQVVHLEMLDLPEGWEANFRGGGNIIKSVYVKEDSTVSVDLQLIQPEDSTAGDYEFIIKGKGNGLTAELPLTISIAEKVPASLDIETDLPTIKGSPDSTFRYSTTIRNNSDTEITLNLSADTPSGFYSKFTLSGKEVSSFPLEANRSKSITVELEPITDISAGEYPFTVYADGGELQA